jgi:hypothetical protein
MLNDYVAILRLYFQREGIIRGLNDPWFREDIKIICRIGELTLFV